MKLVIFPTVSIVDGQPIIRIRYGDYEFLDFPEDHPCIATVGRFLKHIALLDIGRAEHNAFCRYCEW